MRMVEDNVIPFCGKIQDAINAIQQTDELDDLLMLKSAIYKRANLEEGVKRQLWEKAWNQISYVISHYGDWHEERS